MSGIASKVILTILIVIALSVGAIWWTGGSPHPRIVHTSEGYGGYVSAGRHVREATDPLDQAMNAYDSGKYKRAEAEAQEVIDSMSSAPEPAKRKMAVKAREILAFSAARRRDLALARERFSVMEREAAKLPDKGRQEPEPGYAPSTLTEQAAYQHAVCTVALGDKKGGEREYVQFMRDFPESPLIHGAIERIRRMHDGHYPPEAEAVWKHAVKVAQERERQRQRDAAVCGPECIAELMARKGQHADVKALAAQMGTTEKGTSLQAVADAARKLGYSPKGYELTFSGLQKQHLPLIALVSPGHFVIVDKVGVGKVTICDPAYKRIDKPTVREVSLAEWRKMWGGIVLAL